MNKLDSDKIVVEAPMSFTGATKRLWKLTRTENTAVKWALLVPLVLAILTLTYCLVLAWYTVFGVLVIPYRLLRRSQRRSRKESIRHRELMAQKHSI